LILSFIAIILSIIESQVLLLLLALTLGTLLGMYRWLILSLTAYLIAHWTYLLTQFPSLPDWGEAAQTALKSFFPQIVVSLLILSIQRLIPVARSRGFDINISRCKI